MIVCHGGAGAIGAERHDRLRAGVRIAAEHGHAILANFLAIVRGANAPAYAA